MLQPPHAHCLHKMIRHTSSLTLCSMSCVGFQGNPCGCLRSLRDRSGASGAGEGYNVRLIQGFAFSALRLTWFMAAI